MVDPYNTSLVSIEFPFFCCLHLRPQEISEVYERVTRHDFTSGDTCGVFSSLVCFFIRAVRMVVGSYRNFFQ